MVPLPPATRRKKNAHNESYVDLTLAVYNVIFGVRNRETQCLMRQDPCLGHLIEQIGDISLPLRRDAFPCLVEIIIGQQLSSKVATTLTSRVLRLCGVITPDSILNATTVDLRACGLSRRKVDYITELSKKVRTHEVNLESLAERTNEEALDVLTSLNGVGRWTAEMFLIFSLGRLDVMSFGDAGLQRSACWLYDFSRADVVDQLRETSQKWSPYETIASLYLWEAINRGFVAPKSKDE